MKSGRGKLILISAYLAFIIAVVYLANTHRLLAPFLSWLNRTPGADKICHFVLAGGLALAVNWFLNCRPLGPTQLGTAICLVFAAVEETSQIWNPVRTFDLGDMAMNSLGILLIGPFAKKLPARPDSPARPSN